MVELTMPRALSERGASLESKAWADNENACEMAQQQMQQWPKLQHSKKQH